MSKILVKETKTKRILVISYGTMGDISKYVVMNIDGEAKNVKFDQYFIIYRYLKNAFTLAFH